MPDDKATSDKATNKSGVTTTSPKPGSASDVDKAPDAKTADLLAAAGASADAEVQNLLAQRRIHEQNGDEQAVAGIDEQLRQRVER